MCSTKCGSIFATFFLGKMYRLLTIHCALLYGIQISLTHFVASPALLAERMLVVWVQQRNPFAKHRGGQEKTIKRYYYKDGRRLPIETHSGLSYGNRKFLAEIKKKGPLLFFGGWELAVFGRRLMIWVNQQWVIGWREEVGVSYHLSANAWSRTCATMKLFAPLRTNIAASKLYFCYCSQYFWHYYR